MALAEQERKGGPYTKKEQQERRDEVFRLHFEKGFPALKIADMLNINRNTINEDLKYWYSEFSEKWKKYDIRAFIMKQIYRLETQRIRLLEELDKQEKFKDRMEVEKLLLEIDNKLTLIGTKIILGKKSSLEPTTDLEGISEEMIKKFVRYLIQKSYKIARSCNYIKNEILIEIIRMEKCDQQHAEIIISKMMELGLDVCKIKKEFNFQDDSPIYDMRHFARIRNYVSKEEFFELTQKLKEKERRH